MAAVGTPVARAATTSPGCHHCGAPAEVQWQRHATEAEYDQIPDKLKPIDGRALIRVDGCGDHAMPPFCTHTLPPEQPCPTCHAQPGTGCTKPDGTLRPVDHPARIKAVPQPEPCRHAHREDCPGYGQCQCTQDDPEPVRVARIPPPDDRPARAAHQQQLHEAELAWHQQLLAKHGGGQAQAAAEASATYWAFLAEHTQTRDTPPAQDPA